MKLRPCYHTGGEGIDSDLGKLDEAGECCGDDDVGERKDGTADEQNTSGQQQSPVMNRRQSYRTRGESLAAA